MVRNSILYHRLWYLKKNKKKIYAYVVCIIALIVLTLAISYVKNILMPQVMEISVPKAEALVESLLSREIYKAFPEGINYEEFVTIGRESKGGILYIKTDSVRLRRLSEEFAGRVQQEISLCKPKNIPIPLADLYDINIAGRMGNLLNAQIIPLEIMEADFKSEVSDMDDNQTKHIITFSARVEVAVSAFLTSRRMIVTAHIPVCQTIIEN